MAILKDVQDHLDYTVTKFKTLSAFIKNSHQDKLDRPEFMEGLGILIDGLVCELDLSSQVLCKYNKQTNDNIIIIN